MATTGGDEKETKETKETKWPYALGTPEWNRFIWDNQYQQNYLLKLRLEQAASAWPQTPDRQVLKAIKESRDLTIAGQPTFMSGFIGGFVGGAAGAIAGWAVFGGYRVAAERAVLSFGMTAGLLMGLKERIGLKRKGKSMSRAFVEHGVAGGAAALVTNAVTFPFANVPESAGLAAYFREHKWGGIAPLYNGIGKFMPGSVAYWSLFLGMYEAFRSPKSDYPDPKAIDSSSAHMWNCGMLMFGKSLTIGWASSTLAGLVTSPISANGLSSAFRLSNMPSASLFQSCAARGLRGGVMISLFDMYRRLAYVEM